MSYLPIIFINQWVPGVISTPVTDCFTFLNFGVTLYSEGTLGYKFKQELYKNQITELADAFCLVVAKKLLARCTSTSFV